MPVLRRVAEQYLVVTVTGPRQSGKTTLVRHAFADLTYVLGRATCGPRSPMTHEDSWPPTPTARLSAGHDRAESILLYGGDRRTTRRGTTVLPWNRVHDIKW
jgi:hypothetical protein